jgi:hypothetical protein
MCGQLGAPPGIPYRKVLGNYRDRMLDRSRSRYGSGVGDNNLALSRTQIHSCTPKNQSL